MSDSKDEDVRKRRPEETREKAVEKRKGIEQTHSHIYRVPIHSDTVSLMGAFTYFVLAFSQKESHDHQGKRDLIFVMLVRLKHSRSLAFIVVVALVFACYLCVWT